MGWMNLLEISDADRLVEQKLFSKMLMLMIVMMVVITLIMIAIGEIFLS